MVDFPNQTTKHQNIVSALTVNLAVKSQSLYLTRHTREREEYLEFKRTKRTTDAGERERENMRSNEPWCVMASLSTAAAAAAATQSPHA